MKARILGHLQKDYVRFVLVGAVNTGASFALYTGGIMLGLSYVIANVIAWAVSVGAAFLLQSYFVFRKSGNLGKRFRFFVLSNIFSLVVSMGMLSLLIKVFALNPILAATVTMPVVVIMNFAAAKFIVFL